MLVTNSGGVVRVLELGSYVSVAYAGMLLAEQGHRVEKWVSPTRADPIQGLRRGAALWDWINKDKAVVRRHAVAVSDVPAGTYDVVLDNVRRETWRRWGLDPEVEAQRLNVAWISLRDELDGRSFDVVAQARAWMDHAGYVPFYVGDTAAGLWLAFKACNAAVGHHVLGQASVLAKLVEGELCVPTRRDGVAPPWDEPGTYGAHPATGASVIFRDEAVTEPVRDDEWRWNNLRHRDGRIIV